MFSGRCLRQRSGTFTWCPARRCSLRTQILESGSAHPACAMGGSQPPFSTTGAAHPALHLRLLLLRAGDVEVKPEPVCSGCTGTIRVGSHPIICTQCQRLFHVSILLLSYLRVPPILLIPVCPSYSYPTCVSLLFLSQHVCPSYSYPTCVSLLFLSYLCPSYYYPTCVSLLFLSQPVCPSYSYPTCVFLIFLSHVCPSYSYPTCVSLLFLSCLLVPPILILAV